MAFVYLFLFGEEVVLVLPIFYMSRSDVDLRGDEKTKSHDSDQHEKLSEKKITQIQTSHWIEAKKNKTEEKAKTNKSIGD